jgi:hypothetical protein
MIQFKLDVMKRKLSTFSAGKMAEFLMSLIRVFATTLITALFLAAPSFAQNSKVGRDAGVMRQEKVSSQVEVETDRFSGKTTVRLKPQVLLDTPERKLVMVIDGQGAFFGIRFDSISRDYIIYGDRELWFIVDGKRTRIDAASEASAPFVANDKDEQGRRPWVALISSMSLAQAEEIVAGDKVEMRLGTVELTWSQPVLSNMREYVRTLARYAPSRQKTRGREPW